MPNLRVQRFIYKNLVQRARVNRFLDRFGNGINALAKKIGFSKDIYATGLTRNKAILFSSLVDPKIPAAEVGAAMNMLLYSDRVRAFLAVVKDYDRMSRKFHRDILNTIAEKLQTKGIEVPEKVVEAVLKDNSPDQTLDLFGKIIDKIGALRKKGVVVYWAFEILPALLGSNTTDQIIEFIEKIAERIGTYLDREGMAGWMPFLNLPAALIAALKVKSLALDEIIDLFDKHVFLPKNSIRKGLVALTEAIEAAQEEDLTEEQIIEFVDEHIKTLEKQLTEPLPDIEEPEEPSNGEDFAPAKVDPAALFLRDEVRQCSLTLLFSRNIDLNELKDMIRVGKLRNVYQGGVKYFRYGLGHEYGEPGSVLTIVMKRSFWESEKGVSKLGNLFLREVNGKSLDQDTLRFTEIDKSVQHDLLLRDLAANVEYNRFLEQRPADDPLNGILGGEDLFGRSVLMGDVQKFMGNFPQLEIMHDISLDQVDSILVPEHMWDEVSKICEQNPELASLLHKVEGTGETREDFLKGRELLARRTRFLFGRFEPNFGYESFHLFEQEYFKIVLGVKEEDISTDDFVSRAYNLMNKYEYDGSPPYARWLLSNPQNGKHLVRKKDDWKIFINPREENFFKVLETVLKILSDNSNLGITFKIPHDLSQEWRPGRKFGSASNTPKIIVHVNEQVLPGIIDALDEVFVKASLKKAGFGESPGPSFARRHGRTDLLFYKKEYGFDSGGDKRAGIANDVERVARRDGFTNENEIWRRKKLVLHQEGFRGENFYIRTGDFDPVLGRIVE